MIELDTLVHLLEKSATYYDPNPGRGQVDGLVHALQTATLAERDGASPDVVVMALVHDAARDLNDAAHGAVIAEAMRERLPDDCLQALRYHGDFQQDFIHGGHRAQAHTQQPWYPLARQLADWDGSAYDPDFEPQPLEHFIPMLATAVSRCSRST